MRKTFVLLTLLVLALPVAGIAAVRGGDGTLSVEDGIGKVTLQARGGVIGRLDRGFVTIYDLSPDDAYAPYVVGDDQPVRFVGENGIRYGGLGLRFRLIGGNYRIVIEGRGIDLSVVAKGSGSITAGSAIDPGVYSLDGDDCRSDRASCTPLPELTKRFQLGNDRGKKSLVGPASD
ncbi:MAG TPA: hypothetical protein VM049_09680 [Gaiellaceae bacterium]|nr:hypothetical protein [Gaiellaceae bacterium]